MTDNLAVLKDSHIASRETSLSVLPEQLESNVRSYCRSFPVTFASAQGAEIIDVNGLSYIDFFCGAGSLNYGHNPQDMKNAVIAYIQRNGIVQSLDLSTESKTAFMEDFYRIILEPRKLNYRIQFTGPTGTNGVEAALKLAQKVTQRTGLVSFNGAFHGLSLGALHVTSNRFFHDPAYPRPQHVTMLPKFGDSESLALLADQFAAAKNTQSLPAAVIIETIQAEGGVNIAPTSWLISLAQLCQQFGVLLIVDDIQVGVGRTGRFFSFEESGIQPDIVVLSKSLSGFGLPMTAVLFKPELDAWLPGEHSGTFRGNGFSFTTARLALHYWQTPRFSQDIVDKGQIIFSRLTNISRCFPELNGQVRGVGMINGLEVNTQKLAGAIQREAFKQRLILETCGPEGRILKLMPPLVIEKPLIHKALDRLHNTIQEVLK